MMNDVIMDFDYYIFLPTIDLSVTSVQNVGKTQQQTDCHWRGAPPGRIPSSIQRGS